MIQKKVANGDLGIKSGQGFFPYQGKRPETFWEQVNGQIMRVLKATKTDTTNIFKSNWME